YRQSYLENKDQLRRMAMRGRLPVLKNKKVLLISHDLTQTGAPLVLVETAAEMVKSGALPVLTSLKDDTEEDNLAQRFGIPTIAMSRSFEEALEADLVIANTSVSKYWINEFLETH